MYMGTTKTVNGILWEEGKMYQFDGIGKTWTSLAFPTKDNRQNASKYIEGTSDLTKGAPQAVFSQAQIGSAVLDSLFTALMNSQEIELQEVTGPDGIVRKGILKSSNYSSINKTGFKIDTNGDAEFNDAILRGIIEALGGYFKDISGENMHIKGGVIDVGPLHISSMETGNTPDVPWEGTKKVTDFVNDYIPENPEQGKKLTKTIVAYYGGNYGTSTLHSFVVEKESRWVTGDRGGGWEVVFSATFYTGGGSVVRPGTTPGGLANDIGAAVLIKGGGSGNTFKLTGLPTEAPTGTDAGGKIYRDLLTNNLKIVPDR
jgi:hypothetical protein